MENATPPEEEHQEKDLDYYMELHYNVDVLKHDENGYTVGIRELPWITARNQSMSIAFELLDCSKDSWLQDAVKSGFPIPEPPREEIQRLCEEVIKETEDD